MLFNEAILLNDDVIFNQNYYSSRRKKMRNLTDGEEK